MSLPIFRYGLAKPLIGAGLSALAIGAWVYLLLSDAAIKEAASGLVAGPEHLVTLVALERLVVIVVVASALLILYGMTLMVIHDWKWKRAAADLLRQVKLFEEGHWRADLSIETDDELEALGKEMNVLAKKRGEEGEGRDVEEIKSRFLEIISHQLRTPLTAVRWNLEALLKGDLGRLKREQSDLLRITEKNYHGILAMLSDWIEALEVERGLLRLNFAAVDTMELIGSMTPDLREQAWLKRQKLQIAITKDLPPLRADRLKLRFVINKLMSNAMDYTPEKGRIALRARMEGDKVRIEVQDSGIGIPDGDQREIFKKFFRAGNASMMQPNASGVGLFVARTLIEAHGGQMDFSSTEGVGSTFAFTVPAFDGAVKRRTKKS